MQRLVEFSYHQLPSDITRHCFLDCLFFPEDQGIPDRVNLQLDRERFQEASGFHEADNIGREILVVLIKHGIDRFRCYRIG
jgi:disease resistance protein RPS2